MIFQRKEVLIKGNDAHHIKLKNTYCDKDRQKNAFHLLRMKGIYLN